MRARVPASAANLGPGFDVLALALSLYVEVTIEPAARLTITADGEGADVAKDSGHLAAVVARRVLGHDDVAIHVSSSIPVSRGLGSSAAIAVAAAAAAGAAVPDDVLLVASATDGHAENAAASLLGGLVAATIVDGRPLARRLPLDPGLGVVLLVPDRPLQTRLARSVLPAQVPLAAVVHNLGRMGLLVAGLADRAALAPEAGADMLHQAARAAFFPEAPELMSRLLGSGATVATWSGAGPSLLAICDADRAAALREAGEKSLADLGVAGSAMVLRPDLGGLVLSS